jgi:hypothetical protein
MVTMASTKLRAVRRLHDGLRPGKGCGERQQQQHQPGLVDRAVERHRIRAAGVDGAAAEVEEGGILQDRIAAAHGNS